MVFVFYFEGLLKLEVVRVARGELDWRAGFLEVLRSASDGAKKKKLRTPFPTGTVG